MKAAFLTGRIVLGGFYLFNGINLLLSRATMAGFVAARGVPLPQVAVPAAAVLLLVAGCSFLLGWRPLVGIAATVLFLIPVSFFMHPFWSESGAERLSDTVNFAKNMALLAAALMFAAIPRPWTASVEARREERPAAPPIEFYPRREPRRATGG